MLIEGHPFKINPESKLSPTEQLTEIAVGILSTGNKISSADEVNFGYIPALLKVSKQYPETAQLVKALHVFSPETDTSPEPIRVALQELHRPEVTASLNILQARKNGISGHEHMSDVISILLTAAAQKNEANAAAILLLTAVDEVAARAQQPLYEIYKDKVSVEGADNFALQSKPYEDEIRNKGKAPGFITYIGNIITTVVSRYDIDADTAVSLVAANHYALVMNYYNRAVRGISYAKPYFDEQNFPLFIDQQLFDKGFKLKDGVPNPFTNVSLPKKSIYDEIIESGMNQLWIQYLTLVMSNLEKSMTTDAAQSYLKKNKEAIARGFYGNHIHLIQRSSNR